MTPRIVVTSGDPATGVITIEKAPTVEERDYICGGPFYRIQRVPLSLPATVEVAKRCPKCRGTGRGFDWLLRVVPCRKCHGTRFVVLGTATLVGVWEWERVHKLGATAEMLRDIGHGPLLQQDGEAWVAAGSVYDALTPGGLVAYVTDWTEAAG